MGERYVQFLGSKPGIVVEVVDESNSPYIVRAENGFEFSISAEDFRHYYRPEGSPSQPRWRPFVTEPEKNLVDTAKISKVMETIHSFEERFQDFEKARAFVREAVRIIGVDPKPDLRRVLKELTVAGWDQESLNEKELQVLTRIPGEIRSLLLSDTCAVIPLVTGLNAEEAQTEGKGTPLPKRPARIETPQAKKGPAKARRIGMKNAEMTVEGNILTLTVDLSKEFGPSKSGKTIIVASSEGNKSVPGRAEKIGLNVYKQPDKRAAKGRRSTFKNVEMNVEGNNLTVQVDLSKELGPSKSGKTIIIASTEGNQLVLGREEKIGLNVYRKID